jgi:tRNA(Ile)-lysidine synthase
MLESFQAFLRENSLCTPGNKILLTISGGVDSMVMLDLFSRSGFEGEIAHCNFGLRGAESDEDERFVIEIATRYDSPVHVKSFQTEEYASNNNISIQMAARDLRYEWFEDIRRQTDCDFIATAHNKNDHAETFFINLLRGTGIRGLTGIPVVSGNIIRPLLWAEREEILNYSEQKHILFREDSSNAGLKYSRNKIRHILFPELEKIRPGILTVMDENISRLKATLEIYESVLEDKRRELLQRDKDFIRISINSIQKLKPADAWLYELLNDFEFSFPVVKDIVRNLNADSGRQFFSSSYRLIKDRDYLILEPLRENIVRKFYIENIEREINDPLALKFTLIEETDRFQIPPYPDVACFDYDKLDFPLIIRKWESGDYFRPLGMENMKKVSDFFIDIKLSIPEKEKAWILTDGTNIIWIMGYRIDDRFKIDDSTERILKIEIGGGI